MNFFLCGTYLCGEFMLQSLEVYHNLHLRINGLFKLKFSSSLLSELEYRITGWQDGQDGEF
jgi:hypothetical protein